MNTTKQQTGPRPAQIDPETLGYLNLIDRVMSLAPVSRQEHVAAQEAMQKVLIEVERLQMVELSFNSPPPVAAAPTNNAGPEMVSEAVQKIRGLPRAKGDNAEPAS